MKSKNYSLFLKTIIGKIAFRYFKRKARNNKKKTIEKISKSFGENATLDMYDNFINMSNTSLDNIIDLCSNFSFYKYKKELQEKIYFDYGSKDKHFKCIKVLKRNYPYAKYIVREGYDHCSYLLSNQEDFFKELKNKYFK